MLGMPRHILQSYAGLWQRGMPHDGSGIATLQQTALTIKWHVTSGDTGMNVVSTLDMPMNSKPTFALADKHTASSAQAWPVCSMQKYCDGTCNIQGLSMPQT